MAEISMNKPDLLKRLTDHPCEDDPHYGPLLCWARVEALDEIKTLRARVAELEALLSQTNEGYAECIASREDLREELAQTKRKAR